MKPPEIEMSTSDDAPTVPAETLLEMFHEVVGELSDARRVYEERRVALDEAEHRLVTLGSTAQALREELARVLALELEG